MRVSEREEAVTRTLVVVPHGAASPQTEGRLGAADRHRLALLDDAGQAAFLAGREALLRAASGLGERAIVIEAECPDCGVSHGLPTARGAASRIHLSLTHAAGQAIAVASTTAVGVDAEPLDSPAERLAAAGALVPGRGSALWRWTAVEAVLKADGRGLRVDPASVALGRRRASLEGVRYGLRSLRLAGCRVAVATRLGAQSGGSRASRSQASKNSPRGSSE